MKILITGGAGYIGSHTLRQFLRGNDEIYVLDNFSKGSQLALNDLRSIRDFAVFNADLADFAGVRELFKAHNFEAVIHFAASIEVFESVQLPLKYFLNNTANTANLIQACLDFGTSRFIFSSTAATYGQPASATVSEADPTQPINPYGLSKLMSEQILREASRANPAFKHCILRYFNVAGACLDFRLGQRYPNSTLLIKVAAEVAAAKREKLLIYGDDYDTPDGTCVRDFIHVDDLAAAHLAALEFLEQGGDGGEAAGGGEIFNVGYGHGFSVREVVETMKKVSGVDFKTALAPRRAGDPALLVANADKIRSLTSWQPRYDDLGLICKSAYEWERQC